MSNTCQTKLTEMLTSNNLRPIFWSGINCTDGSSIAKHEYVAERDGRDLDFLLTSVQRGSVRSFIMPPNFSAKFLIYGENASYTYDHATIGSFVADTSELTVQWDLDFMHPDNPGGTANLQMSLVDAVELVSTGDLDDLIALSCSGDGSIVLSGFEASTLALENPTCTSFMNNYCPGKGNGKTVCGCENSQGAIREALPSFRYPFEKISDSCNNELCDRRLTLGIYESYNTLVTRGENCQCELTFTAIENKLRQDGIGVFFCDGAAYTVTGTDAEIAAVESEGQQQEGLESWQLALIVVGAVFGVILIGVMMYQWKMFRTYKTNPWKGVRSSRWRAAARFNQHIV